MVRAKAEGKQGDAIANGDHRQAGARTAQINHRGHGEGDDQVLVNCPRVFVKEHWLWCVYILFSISCENMLWGLGVVFLFSTHSTLPV